MPRQKPNFSDHLHYFDGLKIEFPDQNKYNNNVKITIFCENGHTYKLSVNQIKNQNKNPKICPHCKKEKSKEKIHISKKFIENYCNKYNLDFFPKKNSYDRWNDQITFICKKCGCEKEIKTLSYWEKNLKDYSCDGCNIYQGKSKDYISNIFNNILSRSTEKNIILPKTNFTKEPTQTVLKLIDLIKENWYMFKYNGTRNKASFLCLKCGQIKNIFPLNMKGKNAKCKNCFLQNQRKNVEKKLIEICKQSSIYFSDENNFEYKDISEQISFTCNKCGNQFKKSWAEITGCYYNISCPSCNTKNKSLKENELYEFLKSIYNKKINRNDRNMISPYELDIYLPEDNIAFEFCGNIWHSSKFIKDTQYHARKTKLCREKSIRLITIFEDEWDDKKDICKSRLNSILQLNKNILYARNCNLCNLSKTETKEFLNENHIQGYCNFTYSFGLKMNNKLLSIMTFTKATDSRSHDIELSRFAVLKNTTVVGGFSKLLKNFIKKYDFENLASFADLRWSYGNVYTLNGFKLENEIRPRYSYVGNDTLWKRKHRFGFNKTKLIKKYGSKYSHMSEKEITEYFKLYRLYDCGYLKFVIKKDV